MLGITKIELLRLLGLLKLLRLLGLQYTQKITSESKCMDAITKIKYN